jgi:hypothetical protein
VPPELVPALLALEVELVLDSVEVAAAISPLPPTPVPKPPALAPLLASSSLPSPAAPAASKPALSASLSGW